MSTITIKSEPDSYTIEWDGDESPQEIQSYLLLIVADFSETMDEVYSEKTEKMH